MSSVFTSIHSALVDLELLKNGSSFDYEGKYIIKILMLRLKNLRTFLLCARKMVDVDVHKDASLGFLLTRIEDAVCRNAQRIFSLCHNPEHMFPLLEANQTDISELDMESFEEGAQTLNFKHLIQSFEEVNQVINFKHDIESFEDEMIDWFITWPDYSRPLSSPVIYEVVEIIDSVLENLGDVLNSRNSLENDFVELIDALGDELRFLKVFIRFSTLLGTDHSQLEDLLSHIEDVVTNVAHLSYMCQFMMSTEGSREEMKIHISKLLQKIKPVDPHVSKTYTRALTSSKLSIHLRAPTLDMDDDPIIIMKDFIHSLARNLWEMLLQDTCDLVPVKDQLQVLYEGLRFLRTIFKDQPNKFDEKIRDLTAVVICDAGVIIFSLCQKDLKIELGLLDLLERIKLIRTAVEEKVPKSSTFNFPKTNELGFIDSLLENLMELTSCEADSNAQSIVQRIQEELLFLRSFLGEIVELRNEHEELQALWSRVIEVAYRVEFLIDPLVVGHIPDSFCTSFDCITEDARNIKTDALKIFYDKRHDIKVKKVSRTSSRPTSRSSAPITNEVVGFDNEATSIIDRLTRGSKHLRVVAIVGMPGVGKTTLATKVYNDPSVMWHFHVHAWCSVSQAFDKKKVLLDLLNHIIPDRHIEMTEQDLAEELWRRLKGRRYLIFLDDVWDIKAWNSLEGSLPDDSNGSRIILTSRLRDVAPPAMLEEGHHFLRQLTNAESWELLQKKLSLWNGCPPTLHEIGMQIAENCKGLPLTIIIVAGLLATVELEGWKEVLDSLSSGIISSTDQCLNTLELSYKHLPDYLKPCFLYFGSFPEYQEISVKRLIRLWIAEGFIQKTNLKSLEDVAADCMMDLVDRSLVMVAKQRSIGGVKACRIHDLLHDFCMTKAKEENFFQLLQGYDELLAFNEPCYLRRLCIYSKPEHFKKSNLFCSRVRSLLFFSQAGRYERNWCDISFIIHIFKLLRVLDIGQINIGAVFPSEIELLVQLKYLAIQGGMRGIPSSVGNLSKLETFFVVHSHGGMVSLPDTLWNLQKLRHLFIKSKYPACFALPIKNLDNSSNLYELVSLSGTVISSWDSMEVQMRKFPNIRNLECRLFTYGHDTENWNKILVLDFLSRLESLKVLPYRVSSDRIEFDFCFPMNIKKLTLSGFGLPWCKIATIGKLPSLEVLKLLNGAFSGKTWDMEEGEFLKLRFLKLASSNLVRWTASDDQFFNLQKLVLEECYYLEVIPSCLENISTLEMIEVSNSSDSTSSLVKQIQEEQMNLGNSVLKILIRSSRSL